MPLPSRLPDDFIEKAANKPLLIVDRYSIVKKIGSGNFGTAFLINDSQACNESEKKKVLKQICVGPLDPGETVDAMQEAKLLAQMKHNNIVQFHHSFLDGQFFCIVLEYCEGGDLECRIRDCKKKKETIPEDQVIKWLKQLLRAISYMHKSRVLHRDLKSRNIFLKDNQVKIGDFGISKILIGTSDKASTFVGTPYYMSPQVLKHEQYDEKCDVWSLGCVLYEICCLEHAFEGNSLMEVMVKIVSDYVPHLPQTYSRALNNILERMLDREAHRRQTAQQILQHPLLSKRDASLQGGTEHLTARDRLRIKKQREVDAKVLKLKEAAKIKWAENARIRRESVEKNFVRSFDLNVQIQENASNREVDRLPSIPDEELHGTVVFKPHDATLVNSQEVFPETELMAEETIREATLNGRFGSTDELIQTLIQEGHIPEDELLADTFYSLHEDFESSSDEDLSDEHIQISDSEYRDMCEYMEGALVLDESVASYPSRQSERNQYGGFSSSVHNKSVLGGSSDGSRNSEIKNPSLKSETVSGVSSKKLYKTQPRPNTSAHPSERPLSMFNSNMVDQRIINMRERCIGNLGNDLFEKAYQIVKEIRFDEPSSNQTMLQKLTELIPDRNKCMELEQLIFLEHERDAA